MPHGLFDSGEQVGNLQDQPEGKGDILMELLRLILGLLSERANAQADRRRRLLEGDID